MNLMRYVLSIVAGLAVLASAALPAQSLRFDAPAAVQSNIPSAASGVYEGGGWRCTVDARLVFASAPEPAASVWQPVVVFDCAQGAARYVGAGARSQYIYECPRASDYGDATSAQLWPAAPPWTSPVGSIAVRAYDNATPAVLLVDITAPGQSGRVALGRTQTITVPPAYAYSCTPAGTLRLKQGR